MVKKKKRYLGSFSNEEEAARAYDKVALQHHGIKAKTNYDYTKEEVAEIMAAPKLSSREVIIGLGVLGKVCTITEQKKIISKPQILI